MLSWGVGVETPVLQLVRPGLGAPCCPEQDPVSNPGSANLCACDLGHEAALQASVSAFLKEGLL